jgi:hypothetical protein
VLTLRLVRFSRQKLKVLEKNGKATGQGRRLGRFWAAVAGGSAKIPTLALKKPSSGVQGMFSSV